MRENGEYVIGDNTSTANNMIGPFGPFGRSKLVYNGSFSEIVTRDCEQFLFVNGETNLTLRLLLAQLRNLAAKSGDGFLTSYIVGGKMRQLVNDFSINQNRLLRGLEIIISILYREQRTITNFFVANNLWKIIILDRHVLPSHFMNILLPATDISVAKSISNILVSTAD